ncbi:MAG TPA: ABC transporter ATP-binding protein [Gaiellaceae bacterium]|jgi:branched-chain amino acid transport system ATP-binding protein|nr:ABC transporter ATP-binding protein [Gaiellaceae bacterium]
MATSEPVATAEPEPGRTDEADPLLSVRNLNAFYGRAHVLQDVSFDVGDEPVAVVGRNGMGKTTLCNAIVGIPPARVTGSVRFEGRELAGSPSYKITKSGIAYVPQGRRLFQSLSTDEHLRMVGGRSGQWTIGRVYELFPRLSERRKVSGTQLSGGEQQMLAIARALLLNPRLLIMDEPSEGLAPTIVESLIGTCQGLLREGIGLLLIEQNLGVATSVCRRQLVMVGGHIETETTAERLASDPEEQRRWLGVEPTAAAPS